MEARALGLPLSSGYKFDPSDEELVLYYLIPRVCHRSLPIPGAIIDDDPGSAEPWKLLERHRLNDEGFFFGPVVNKYRLGSRRERGCKGGGMWKGQKGVDHRGVMVGGKLLKWRKYVLNYHNKGEAGSTGWVMHEFQLTAPMHANVVLCHIRISEQGKKRMTVQQEGGGGGGGGGLPSNGTNSLCVLPLMPKPEPATPTHLTSEAPGYDYEGAIVQIEQSDTLKAGAGGALVISDDSSPDDYGEIQRLLDGFPMVPEDYVAPNLSSMLGFRMGDYDTFNGENAISTYGRASQVRSKQHL